jgi:hypothetical protein
MSWGRMDDGFDDHPKVVALLDEDDQLTAGAAIGLWTLCWTWAHRNTRKRGKTPGLIPSGLPRRFLGPVGKAAADLLVKHRLWTTFDDGGWLIHDFEDYIPTDETRAARSAAGKRGAASRWASHQKAEKPDEPDTPDGNLPSACHEPDSNDETNDGSRTPARWAISKEIAPTPTPTPIPPAAAGADASARQTALADMPAPPPPGAPKLTDTQRSKRITDAYAAAEKMCNWPAANGVVLKAIKSRKFADEEIQAAMLRLADEGRSVTVDSLRTELRGFPPRRNDQGRAATDLGRRPQSPADQRVQDGAALHAVYVERERQAAERRAAVGQVGQR